MLEFPFVGEDLDRYNSVLVVSNKDSGGFVVALLLLLMMQVRNPTIQWWKRVRPETEDPTRIAVERELGG